MGTRSIILVSGNNPYGLPETYRLYKHWDGYPSGILPLLQNALECSVQQCEDLSTSQKTESKPVPVPEQVIGNLIGAATDYYGLSIKLDDEDGVPARFPESLQAKHFGQQGDLEWIYVVDLTKVSIRVYGGRYTGQVPQFAVKRGTVNPLIYAESLNEEYREQERKIVSEAVCKLGLLGFAVNPKGQRGRNSA